MTKAPKRTFKGWMSEADIRDLRSSKVALLNYALFYTRRGRKYASRPLIAVTLTLSKPKRKDSHDQGRTQGKEQVDERQ